MCSVTVLVTTYKATNIGSLASAGILGRTEPPMIVSEYTVEVGVRIHPTSIFLYNHYYKPYCLNVCCTCNYKPPDYQTW